MASEDTKTAKSKRYDRQLRLWGEHGQEAMEEASICLLNASATGSETLKNLVLPGELSRPSSHADSPLRAPHIATPTSHPPAAPPPRVPGVGSFTIVDGHTVTESDLGNNFFLDASCVGKPRARCVTELLSELNEHVRGSYVEDSISVVLESRADFLHSFSMVIATQLPLLELRQVSAICRARSLPLLVVQSYGFMGYLRLDLGEHHVVETHPDHPFPDLRVLAPPPALLTLLASKYADIASLPNAAYSHVPYVVLLIKAVGAWRDANGGAMPTTYKQKKEVRALVEAFRRPGLPSDLNIEEALAAVNTSLNPATPSSSAAALLGSARGTLASRRAEQAAARSIDGGGDGRSAASPTPGGRGAGARAQLGFWLCAAAVDAFVKQEGAGSLPLIGTIPDMTSDTESYVALQTIYAQQAAADLAAVQAHLHEIARAEGLSAELVSPEALKIFGKNACAVQCVSYSAASAEFSPLAGAPPALAAAVGPALDDAASGGSLYLLYRAALAFSAERSRWPGGAAADAEADAGPLKQCLADVSRELGLGEKPAVGEDLLGEFCRWGGSEMHAVASVMGGIASQEAIKAATHQYTPLNNTFVFNGASGTTSTLTL